MNWKKHNFSVFSSIANEFFRFSCVGAIGTGAHYTVLVVMIRFFRVSPVAASTCGFVAGALINYILNYRWTFKSQKKHKSAMPNFFFIAVIGMIFNAAIMSLLVNSFEVHYLISQIAATFVVLLWNFSGNKIWTFKQAKRF